MIKHQKIPKTPVAIRRLIRRAVIQEREECACYVERYPQQSGRALGDAIRLRTHTEAMNDVRRYGS
jgi:hypothetical protein